MCGRRFFTLVCAVLLSLAAPALSQYYSGYGTGPTNMIPFFNTVLLDQAGLGAARSASALALQIYGPSIGASQFIPQVEPAYKYRPPLYPTNYAGFYMQGF